MGSDQVLSEMCLLYVFDLPKNLLPSPAYVKQSTVKMAKAKIMGHHTLSSKASLFHPTTESEPRSSRSSNTALY